MKLIVAISRDEDTENIINTLIQKECRVTKIASAGGFLRRGMTTLMIGVEDENLEDVIDNVRDICLPSEDGEHCTTLFVLNVKQFTHV